MCAKCQFTGLASGIISRVGSPGSRVEINPARIAIYIPEFGQLRIIAADQWFLDEAAAATQGYLLFASS